jgi:hypothetical protein
MDMGVMNVLKNLSGKKGSMTVEACIVVPIVILSITAVIYISLLLYQYVHIQSMTDTIAEQGALSWSNIKRDIETGKLEMSDINKSGLYWRLFDSDKEVRENRLLDYAESKKSGEMNILSGTGLKTAIKLNNHIIYKNIEITSEDAYRVPAGQAFRVFGFKEYFPVNAESRAAIRDPAEFIRDIDFVIDIEKELENRYPGLKDFADKAREIVKGIKTNIDYFFAGGTEQ